MLGFLSLLDVCMNLANRVYEEKLITLQVKSGTKGYKRHFVGHISSTVSSPFFRILQTLLIENTEGKLKSYFLFKVRTICSMSCFVWISRTGMNSSSQELMKTSLSILSTFQFPLVTHFAFKASYEN